MSSIVELRLANEAAASRAVADARMAKYASQPPNTKRMYTGYQKEWTVRPVLLFNSCIRSICLLINRPGVLARDLRTAPLSGRPNWFSGLCRTSYNVATLLRSLGSTSR